MRIGGDPGAESHDICQKLIHPHEHSAAGQNHAAAGNIGPHIIAGLFHHRNHSVQNGCERFPEGPQHFPGRKRDDTRFFCGQIASFDIQLFFFYVARNRPDANLDLFGRAFADIKPVFFAHITDNGGIKLISAGIDRNMRHHIADEDHGGFGAGSADMNQHLTHGRRKIQPDPQCGAKRCLQKMYTGSSRRQHSIFYSVGLRFREITGNGDHDNRTQKCAPQRFFKEKTQNGSKNIRAFHHRIPQRPAKPIMVGSFLHGFHGIVSRGNRFAAVHIHCAHCRLVKQNTVFHRADGRLRCSDVKTDSFADHILPPFSVQNTIEFAR